MQCVSDTWCVRLRVSVPQSQVESQSALLQMQLSSGIGCVGCQTIPRARSSDHRRQILVCESLRARIRSPLCATCACGGYHRRSRRDAGHPPVRLSACHTCFEAAQNTYVAKVLHNIEEVVCLLAPVSHSINGFTEDQIFRDFGPHVLLLWLYLSVNVSGVFVFGADEPGTADAVISLPCDLLCAATDSFQLNSLSAWWNVDYGPICSGTLQSFAIVIIGFNLEVGIGRGRGRGSVTTSGRAEGVRAGSYLKVATAAAINLDIKLLKLSRPSTFPDPRRG